MIFFVCLYFVISFEVMLPRYNPKFTADPIDAVAYVLGALAFWWVQRSEKLARWY